MYMLLLRDWIFDLKRLLSSSSNCAYGSSDLIGAAIWKTCVTDISDGVVPPLPKVFAGYEALMDEIEAPNNEQDDFLKRQLKASSPFCYQLEILQRIPFVTSKGYLALFSGRMLYGFNTKICILPGAEAPFVIQECENGHFDLLGNMYVFGIMNGEFVKDSDQTLSWREWD
jgi:hypothetical protein